MEKNNAPHDIRHEEMLDFSRQNMINSLQLFFSHTKYSLTLLTTILAASLAIAAFSFDKLQRMPEASKLALVLAAIFLILMGPVSYITHRLVGRYYRLYVSFYVYAARLHERYSSAIEHPWFADLKSRLGDPKNHSENLYDESAVARFLDDEVANFANGGRNSWYFYRWLIFILGAFGTIAGSLILGWLLMNQ
ncbi:hypothetical protein [Nitrosospira multiformis]|uniref:hypothetical protein n=1 Tax=Nitrosospira multiformis TaxID=1231 RepID=UPI000897A93E|nr:hypothetical protein [Nitrosospira multiformis]SEA62318.1 hypothetical protein SAMN05216411_11518 [Nitrosospira multiformis]